MIKNILKEIKPKKMKAYEIADIIMYEQKAFVDFYIKDAHRAKSANIVKELFDKMNNKKFAKALKLISKSDEAELDYGFATIIAGFLEKAIASAKESEKEKKDNEFEVDEEILATYGNLIDKILKKRIKEVNKKLDLDINVVRELLLITPDVDYISDKKFVGIYSQKMLRKLYNFAKEGKDGIKDTKQIKKLFTRLFGKEMIEDIAVNILLEKKEFVKNFNTNQNNLWNLMTDFALEVINKQDKKRIAELLEKYCKRRAADVKNNRDAARRINLSELNDENYKHLVKGIKAFKKNGKENLVSLL